jgi:signal transduction histidine kinase
MLKQRLKLNLLFHDLKSPLAVVEIGATSLLNTSRYGSLSEKQEKVLRRILRNAKVALVLVNDLLELGCAQKGIIRQSPIKISSLIPEVLWQVLDLTNNRMSTKIKDVLDLTQLQGILIKGGITLSISPDIWEKEFYLDEKKIKQIIRNLMSNGLKHMKNSIELAIKEQNNCFICSVEDDGMGISPRYHKKIFEAYFQVDELEEHNLRGHGLGLAGVLILVEEIGGELLLESDVEKGAKFIVLLPLPKKLNEG